MTSHIYENKDKQCFFKNYFYYYFFLQKHGSLHPASSEMTGNLADFKTRVSDIHEYDYQTFYIKRD